MCLQNPLESGQQWHVFLKILVYFKESPRSLASPDCWPGPPLKGFLLPRKETDSLMTRALPLFHVCLCTKMTIRRNQGWRSSYCASHQHCSSWGTDFVMGLILCLGFSRGKTMHWMSKATLAPSPLGKHLSLFGSLTWWETSWSSGPGSLNLHSPLGSDIDQGLQSIWRQCTW